MITRLAVRLAEKTRCPLAFDFLGQQTSLRRNTKFRPWGVVTSRRILKSICKIIDSLQWKADFRKGILFYHAGRLKL